MKYIQLGKSGLTVPSVALGCMRIRDVSAKEAEELVATALELGCNFFEHADIYGQGTCEEAFADAIHMSPFCPRQDPSAVQMRHCFRRYV